MKGKIWDWYAPIYKRAMRAEERSYAFLYRRIPKLIRGKEVLELATGPGLLAKRIAPVTKRMLATDYSEGMIAEAKKGACPRNLRFEVADALSLPYADASFDAVIIVNALHLLPEPERALREIARVLRPDGILIAPNFVKKRERLAGRCWELLLVLAGLRFTNQWTAEEYRAFLEKYGWEVLFSKELRARMPLLYTECKRRAN
ncbi:class I SAM-dependent methyltransferase [Stomatobaculum longum]|uniref:class I SAM-dependent methyltransferase n=1 Tax=Stomatobaculum longum TaxID=796942 RepID=UPI0028D6D6AC|nr:class I SAM-dependent methyltransferase [Stomatobaculum longum]